MDSTLWNRCASGNDFIFWYGKHNINAFYLPLPSSPCAPCNFCYPCPPGLPRFPLNLQNTKHRYGIHYQLKFKSSLTNPGSEDGTASANTAISPETYHCCHNTENWQTWEVERWAARSTRQLTADGLCSQCAKVARIYTSLLVYTSIWGKILVFYSYFCDLLVFLWFRAHSTRCELFHPVKSYGNDSAILKQSKIMLLNFELHRSMCFFKTKTVLVYALLS